MRILTDRLVLRPLRRPDLHTFVQYRNDPEVARWQPWPLPYTRSEAARLFQTADAALPMVDDEWRQIGVALRETNELVGDCGVMRRDEGRQAELGVTIAARHWRQGYAREALSALIDDLFGTHGLHRVCTDVDPRNLPSMALMPRLGMRLEAHMRASLWCRGQWVDECWFGLLRSEWRSP